MENLRNTGFLLRYKEKSDSEGFRNARICRSILIQIIVNANHWTLIDFVFPLKSQTVENNN